MDTKTFASHLNRLIYSCLTIVQKKIKKELLVRCSLHLLHTNYFCNVLNVSLWSMQFFLFTIGTLRNPYFYIFQDSQMMLVYIFRYIPKYIYSFILYFCTVDDNLEDIPEGTHKCFLKQYLKNWPFPHLTHYKVGQIINVDVEGTLQRCTVEAVDCSLMQIVFRVSISFVVFCYWVFIGLSFVFKLWLFNQFVTLRLG